MITVREFIKDEQLHYSDSFIDAPAVSVILPTYCRGDNGLLKKAIDSVLEQTFISFELIIVDDGSVDSTQALVSSYLQKDNRILYIRNDCNSGLPAVRVNQGILHARGKYIAYQFDDDRWTQNGLELLVNAIEKQKELSLVYGQWESYDVKQKVNVLHKEEFHYYKLISGNFIANNSVIHHKEIFNRYGMYDCSIIMRRVCDWDLWLRWAKEIPFIYLDKVVSLVEINLDNSLGATVAYDLLTFRIIFGENRNNFLTPLLIQEYWVDTLEFILYEGFRDKIYNSHILPWKLKHINLCEDKNIYVAPFTKRQRIIVTKFDYDSTVSIMVENFISLRPNDYQLIYVPEAQLQYEYLLEGDILLLCRATAQTTLDIVNRIKTETRQIAILYFIDDDLLNIYKLGEEFSYIAPGKAMYVVVENLLSLSDRIVSFSSNIANSIRKYNKCITILRTNILSKYLSNKDSYSENEIFDIVFMGGEARKEEFSVIQDDLARICKKYKSKVRFTFIGYIPEKMKEVKDSKVIYIEYSSSYYQYLNRLSTFKFNLMLCPLYDNDFKRGKSPIKLLEACCCSAIGLFSDVPVYSCIEDGVHGYKIKNGESWFDKIDQIMQEQISEKKKVFNQAIKLVNDKYSTEKVLPQFCLAIKTAELASYIQKKTILYVSHSAYLAGAENHLFRHCLLSKQAGFHVVFALPSSAEGHNLEMEKMAKDNSVEIIFLNYINYCEIEDINRNQAIENGECLLQSLNKYNIALIHSCTLIPAIGYISMKLDIPYIASLYATESNYICKNSYDYFMPNFVHSDSVIYSNKWQDKLGCASRCIRSYIPNEFFKIREIKVKSKYRIAISGTLQERKRQRELIEAVGMIKNDIDIELYLFGYDHFFPNYKKQCVDTAIRYNIENKVFFKGLVTNLYDVLDELDIDIVVCASTFESFPQVILEAMALEIAVVSTPVAGVPELILNKETGFLSSGFEASDISNSIKECIRYIENKEIQTILQRAKETLKRECSFYNVSYQLFDIYIKSFNMCNDKFKKNNSYRLPTDCKPSISDSKKNRLIESDILVFSKGLTGKRKYNIICDVNKLSKVGIIFASINGGAKGYIVMNLYCNGRVLRKSKIAMEGITLDDWSYFEFDPLYGAGGKILTIEFIFKYINSLGTIGLYEDKRNRTFIYKVFNKLDYHISGMNALYVDCQS